jgi:ribosomal protein S27E
VVHQTVHCRGCPNGQVITSISSSISKLSCHQAMVMSKVLVLGARTLAATAAVLG